MKRTGQIQEIVGRESCILRRTQNYISFALERTPLMPCDPNPKILDSVAVSWVRGQSLDAGSFLLPTIFSGG